MLSMHEARDHLRADFAVNASSASRATLVVWRIGQAGHGRRDVPGFLLRRLHGVLNQVWVRGFIGADLPRSVSVGPGLRIPHEARGVVLSPFSSIGAGVTLYHQVTLGIRGNPHAAPVLADGAYVGAGAKLIGAVRVGVGSSLGANAVLTRDVPDGETWVGIPARPVTRRLPDEAGAAVATAAAEPETVAAAAEPETTPAP